jgi:lysophospholipase L1-like esterase
MKKPILYFLFVFLCSSFHLAGQELIQKFYLDFGQNNPAEGRRITEVDANGSHWNNVVAPNGSPSTLNPTSVSLKNAQDTPTAYTLEVVRAMESNGGLNGGLATPDPALLGDLAVGSATEDYFFLADGKGKGLLKFKNLAAGKAYKFYIYGCRTAPGAQRGIIYSLSGKNGSHGKQLNTGDGIGDGGYNGNNNNVWESAFVAPAGNGEITLELGRLFSNQMAYISALKMEEYSGFTLPVAETKFYIDFGKNNNGLDGAPTANPDVNGSYWNNMYSNGDGPTSEIATPSFNLVTSANEATTYFLEQTGNPQWNGVRNGALGGADSPNEPTATLLGDLAIKTATYDYLFLDGAQTAVLNFKNLNPAKQYRFNVFGSRTDGGSEGRVGRIEIAGANSATGIHQMGGAGIGAAGENYNNQTIFVSDLLIPDSEKKIVLTLTTWLGFAHIRCIKLEEFSGAELPAAAAIGISGGNAITGCGRFLQLAATATPQGALCPPVAWSVDDETVARITEAGKLYAKANGTVTVTATATLEDNSTLAGTKEITISGQNIGDHSFTVMGSSVPWGQGAEPRDVNGYAWLWTAYLQSNAAHSWTTNNISIGGNTTTDVANRWDSDLLPSCSRYVYYGLSLGNEGIHERGQAAFDSWRDNMLRLIERTRSYGKIPLVGNSYPRGDFDDTDYGYLKQLNLLIHEWDVPSVNLLGAIDNGYGQWASGYVADNAHPNTAGHAEMFHALVPSLPDALAEGKPQPVRNGTVSLALAKTNSLKRIAFTPENILHSFTLSFAFKTTAADGMLASFITAAGDTVRLALGGDGKLDYKAQPSAAALNNGSWHTATLTHYYAWGKTQLYIDGARSAEVSERLAPVQFYLNDFGRAPQSVEYRELFLYRAGMCAEEVNALVGGKMLKSSLEIYAPLDGSAAKEVTLKNLAQSLNVLTIEEQPPLHTGMENVSFDFTEAITLFPNPFAGKLHLSGAEGCSLRVVNGAGATVYTRLLTSSGEAILTENLPAGLYFFHLEKGGKSKTLQAVKK